IHLCPPDINNIARLADQTHSPCAICAAAHVVGAKLMTLYIGCQLFTFHEWLCFSPTMYALLIHSFSPASALNLRRFSLWLEAGFAAVTIGRMSEIR
ncbi:MAG: hypothetical protein Q9M25_05295, partial [Mariprofundaceae bacterium]|nr:hypothetical protein [Mariprofundaceae bacterium]